MALLNVLLISVHPARTSISAGPLSVQTRREFFLKERISKGPLHSERLSSYFNIQKWILDKENIYYSAFQIGWRSLGSAVFRKQSKIDPTLGSHTKEGRVSTLSIVYFTEERTGVHLKGSPSSGSPRNVSGTWKATNVAGMIIFMMRFKFSEIFDMQEAVKEW